MGILRPTPHQLRIARLVSVCAFALCATATMFAFVYPVLLQRSTPNNGVWSISLLNGAAQYYREPALLGMGDQYDLHFVPGMRDKTIWWPRTHFIAVTRTLFILVPMWIPLLLLGGFGALVVWRERIARTGLCRGCGYDLRGLASGARCPECGRTPRAVTSSG